MKKVDIFNLKGEKINDVKLDEINKTTRLYSPYDTYDFQINILEELLGE